MTYLHYSNADLFQQQQCKVQAEMTKGGAKTNSSEAIDPPQCGELRSRKRECPSDKTCPPDEVDHQQDTEEVSAACVGIPPQSPQSPLKDCVMISVQRKQAAKHVLITKQDTTEENSVNYYDMTAKTSDMQEVPTIINPNGEVQLEGCAVLCDNDGNKDVTEKEQKEPVDCSKSTTKTCIDPTQMFKAMSAEGNESKPSALKDELSTEDNPDHKMETNNEERNSVCRVDAEEKESAAGLPSKKKRRMGMCHMTEKERCQFLQEQYHVNQKPREEQQTCNITQMAERQNICPPPTSSSPQHNLVTTSSGRELSNAKKNLQSIDSGDDSAEKDVANTVPDPHCSRVNISEATTPALDPEQTPEFLPQGQVENRSNQEVIRVSEIPENKTRNMEDVPAKEDHDTFHRSTHMTEETVKENQNVVKTPTEQCGSDGGPGLDSFPLDSDLPQTRVTEELFGSGGLDFVTDSQLNTIVLTEQEAVLTKGDAGSSNVYEDGTNLICGLIKELSSLNRTVMATHRDLENLRSKKKNSRSSLC